MDHFKSRADRIANASARPSWRVLTVSFAFMAALLMFSPGAWAQDNATINGTVTDSTGAVVPNAAMTLTNPATGQTRSAISNGAGEYRFANLGVGSYTLSASAGGFQKYTQTDLVVHPAQSLEANVALQVGSQGQTVTVTADALQVQDRKSVV